MDDKSEAQRGLVTYLRSHSQEGTGWRLELSLSLYPSVGSPEFCLFLAFPCEPYFDGGISMVWCEPRGGSTTCYMLELTHVSWREPMVALSSQLMFSDITPVA